MAEETHAHTLPTNPDGTIGLDTFRRTINAGVSAQGYHPAWRPDGAPPPPPRPRRLGAAGVDRALDAWHEQEDAKPYTVLGVLGSYIRRRLRGESDQPIRIHLDQQSQTLGAPKWIDARSALVRVATTVTPPRDGFGVSEAGKPVRRSEGWRATTHEPPQNSPAIDKRWRPTAEPTGQAARRRVYEVQRAIRPIQRRTSRDGRWSRIASCGHALGHGRDHVNVMVRPSTGRARYAGLQTCGSVWECPSCAARIQAGRADELRQAVEAHWGIERAMMVTLTIRHSHGDDLEQLRRGLAEAWRKMRSGNPWKRIERQWGIRHYIKAMEVTHGPNGWHPHLHVIFLMDAPIAEQRWRKDRRGVRYLRTDAERAEGGDGPPRPYDTRAHVWLRRWQAAVAKTLGDDYVPSDTRGLHIRPCERATYIAKFGLELAGIGKADASNKKEWRKRNGYRAPFEIAASFADTQSEADAKLWRQYCEGITGTRHLTWSRGLKQEAAVREVTDQRLAEGEDPGGADEALIGHIDAADWVRLRKTQVRPEPQKRPWLKRPATLWVLEQVEAQGARALPGLVSWALDFGSAYAPGSEPESVAPG